MFSFTKIAAVAVLAFATFAYAMPAPAPSFETSALEARTGGTAIDVLTQLHLDLQVKVNLLVALTPVTITVDVLAGILADIVLLINTAVSNCHGLPNGSGDLLALLSVIIQLVIGGCGSILKLKIDLSLYLDLFLVLDACLAGLVNLVLGLVLGLLGGILSIVVGLLVSLLGGGCTSIILQLKLTVLAKVLLL